MVEKKHIPNYLWTALGISLLVFVVVVVILALRGPAIGNVFSNVIMGGFDSNSVAQSSAAAMKDVEKKLASTNSQLSQTRLIIREGNLNMIVEDTRSTREAII
ncbi:MAG: hypothetical protein OEZ02_01615, partial [Anaerolineae bacterium]|nr:hypothetical protein [Anaerolineae bacterium]